MPDSTLGSRLRMARERAKMKGVDVVRILSDRNPEMNISSSKLSNWECDQNEPSREDLGKLIELYNLTGAQALYVLTGSGSFENEGSTVGVTLRTMRGRLVPHRDQAMAVLEKIPQEYQPRPEVVTYFECGPRTFVITIEDKSNTPHFEPGDAVAIDPDLTPQPGDMVFAAVTPGHNPIFRRYVKRTAPDASKYIELQPLNPSWESDIIKSADDGRIVGVMTEHVTPRR